MTHGEQWWFNKQKFYKNGKRFESCDSIDKGLPKRMHPRNASAYYNQKLLDYWVKGFDKKIRLDKRIEIIKISYVQGPQL